jgi:transcription initiation factor TFIID subunit 1, fungi type
MERLKRNKERRHAREKQKGIFRASAERDAGSPSATPAPSDKPVGTTRKCANCGQAGHIKTNKKYCDLCRSTFPCFIFKAARRVCIIIFISWTMLTVIPQMYRLCPMLNGTIKPEDGTPDHGFGAISTPSFGS